MPDLGVQVAKGRSVDAVQSIRELARRVGRNKTAVTRWLADPRWPFARRGPWDAATVSRIRAWAAATLEPDRAEAAGESATAAAGLACWIPASTMTKGDPTEALRHL